MFKNALIYRFDDWDAQALTTIEARLQAARFVECSPSQQESAGWVAPRGEKHAALIESVGRQLILQLCTETRAVPNSALKPQLEARLDQIEKETGRRPKGKRVREMKDELVHELLPRAFPKPSNTLVWLDAKAMTVLVGATSAKRADALVTRLIELLGGGMALRQVQTQLAPATAMAAWLTERQAPAGFSIDRECELKQPDSEKAAVRYARHALEIDEIAQHIKAGKLPTQLALTWRGRVSFVLTEIGALKKIKLLDGVLEGPGRDAQSGDDSGFDADVAIATGELRQLLPELIEALGGLQVRDAAMTAAMTAAASAPAESPAAAAKPSTAPWDEVAA